MTVNTQSRFCAISSTYNMVRHQQRTAWWRGNRKERRDAGAWKTDWVSLSSGSARGRREELGCPPLSRYCPYFSMFGFDSNSSSWVKLYFRISSIKKELRSGRRAQSAVAWAGNSSSQVSGSKRSSGRRSR